MTYNSCLLHLALIIPAASCFIALWNVAKWNSMGILQHESPVLAVLFLVQVEMYGFERKFRTSKVSSREITVVGVFDIFSTCWNQVVLEIIGISGCSDSENSLPFALHLIIHSAQTYIKSFLVSHTIKLWHLHFECNPSHVLAADAKLTFYDGRRMLFGTLSTTN